MIIDPINPIEIRNDRPVIAGAGLKVAIIAHMIVKHATPIAWVAENYDLTPAQIHAALSYYYDHQVDLDRWIEEGEALTQAIGMSLDDWLEQRGKRDDTT